jgi:hypothetical protein
MVLNWLFPVDRWVTSISPGCEPVRARTIAAAWALGLKGSSRIDPLPAMARRYATQRPASVLPQHILDSHERFKKAAEFFSELIQNILGFVELIRGSGSDDAAVCQVIFVEYFRKLGGQDIALEHHGRLAVELSEFMDEVNLPAGSSLV